MKKPGLSRRDFLINSSLVALPLTLGGHSLFALPQFIKPSLDSSNDNILVLLQLQGGNDGLATIFHSADYENLHAARSNIIVPEANLLNFSGDYSFHPAMQGLKDIWDTEKLAIIQNVGYPNQNRSHFRSTDIWNTASGADEYFTTGWIGRYYDLNYSDYPMGYPNVNDPHPFALTMGKIVSETCQGINTNYSLSLLDPFNPGSALVSAEGATTADCYGDALSFVNNTIAQTNAYSTVISSAAEMGNNISNKWDDLTTELAQKLKNVARLISGGLQTRIYIVQLGGFDTHDKQVDPGSQTTGIHANLLRELSDAILAFQDDLNLLGYSDRVIGMTYSEFGRRIRSNSALGTDHGTAAPLFLFGSCIENQILGDAPEIDTEVGYEDGVPMQFDFRDVYGTVLHKWLGVSEMDTMNILHPEYNPLPLFRNDCLQSAASPPPVKFPHGENGPHYNSGPDGYLSLYPIPVIDYINIEFRSSAPEARIRIFDARGGLVKTIHHQGVAGFVRTLSIDLSDLLSGNYYIHVNSGDLCSTRKCIVL